MGQKLQKIGLSQAQSKLIFYKANRYKVDRAEAAKVREKLSINQLFGG